MLHNFWFAQHGLAGSYVPLAIPPERLEAALRALPSLNFAGCNLTIPLKQDAMKIVDEVDITAKKIGAMSCVVVRKDGSLPAPTTTGTASPTTCSISCRTGAPIRDRSP